MDLKFLTSNDHKFEEMQNQLHSVGINLIHEKIKYGEVQADTIKDVARQSLASMVPVVSGNFILEDAGLEIETLNNFPGPYSSYIYSTLGNEMILSLMRDENNRNASFVSVIGLYHNGETFLFEGRCDGSITQESKGKHGFGYDPIFMPEGQYLTYAELDLETKVQISHRSKAVTKLIHYLNSSI